MCVCPGAATAQPPASSESVRTTLASGATAALTPTIVGASTPASMFTAALASGRPAVASGVPDEPAATPHAPAMHVRPLGQGADALHAGTGVVAALQRPRSQL